ncbi:MAG: glycoside-pentoside-hexuronide (GPH):cation symporter [Clostridia bacterium]|nr:glycoside-pentoside-hexuronide (GPH):cation symporter [Clostridia bacterium]
MQESTNAPALPPEEAERERRRRFEKNKWLFSASGIGRDMVYQLIASFLLTYIQFGVSLTLAQFTTLSLIIGVGGRIWDAINDPLMGAIIEGSHIRWGKFKPWILLGAISCGLVIICMFGIQSIPGWRFVVFMSVIYLLWESTFTMNDIGYWAMLPSLSSVKEERNAVTMLTVLFAGIGAIIAQGVIPMVTVGDVRAGYRMVAIVIALVFIGSQVMTAVGVKETPRPRAEKAEKISLKKMWKTIARNDQILWMTLSMLFYNIGSTLLTALAANLLYLELGYNGTLYFYVVCAYGITSVVVNILYPWLVGMLGRRRLQDISIGAAIVGYILLALMGWSQVFPFSIVLLCAFCVLISSGQSLFYMASIVNMTNCVEYNDYKHGERNEAVVSTLRPFMAKFAAAMHTLIITLVLTVSGTFLLSQSISALETQRDFFARMEGLELGTAAYDALAVEIGEEIAADPAMAAYQLDPQYIPALGDAMVMATDAAGGARELGRLGELDPAALTAGESYTLEVGDLSSGEESAANLHFRDKRTLSMRVWLRLAVTLVPILLLLAALFIQKRKFIIDEA